MDVTIVWTGVMVIQGLAWLNVSSDECGPSDATPGNKAPSLEIYSKHMSQTE